MVMSRGGTATINATLILLVAVPWLKSRSVKRFTLQRPLEQKKLYIEYVNTIKLKIELAKQQL